MLDGIVGVALANRPRHRALSRQARELSVAPICYDHLAGRLAVELTEFFAAQEYLVIAEVTDAGAYFLVTFGIDLS